MDGWILLLLASRRKGDTENLYAMEYRLQLK